MLLLSIGTLVSCVEDDDATDDDPLPQESDFRDLLSNQVNEVILPTMVNYQGKTSDLVMATTAFANSINKTTLTNLRTAYKEAYLAYQTAAMHNYFATANLALVTTSNLYPVDTSLLANLIANKSYNFNTEAQRRANGFPALDFLLYGSNNTVNYFSVDSNRIAFMENLTIAINLKAEMLIEQWQGKLKDNFISNGGVALGSSISTQLNESIFYAEDHIRENKVGIPIGRLGPNDSPIPPDATKIESYYQAQYTGNETFTFELLKAAVEEMEDIYLGETFTGSNSKGYDDLLLARGKQSIDIDIKAKFKTIYDQINTRTNISGDDVLYQNIQGLITLYKSDLLPVLNVQDADGINDGD